MEEKKITRKQAIKKAGLVAASTVTMMTLLNKNADAAGMIPKDWHPNGWNSTICDPKTSPGHK